MYIIMDVWDGSYRGFQAFVRSPSTLWSVTQFDQPNLAHMMAEQAVKDSLWYRAARAVCGDGSQPDTGVICVRSCQP